MKMNKLVAKELIRNYTMPTNSKDFIAKVNADFGFATTVEALGYRIIGECVITPDMTVMAKGVR